jgi:hypothetical protein
MSERVTKRVGFLRAVCEVVHTCGQRWSVGSRKAPTSAPKVAREWSTCGILFHGTAGWHCASSSLFHLATPSAGGFLEKVAKHVSARVQALVTGKIQDLPKAIVAPIAGPVVDKVADAVGGSIGQTLP